MNQSRSCRFGNVVVVTSYVGSIGERRKTEAQHQILVDIHCGASVSGMSAVGIVSTRKRSTASMCRHG